MHAALTRDAFFQVWQVEKRYSMFDGLHKKLQVFWRPPFCISCTRQQRQQ
jgi:hypothetical protein